MAEDRPEASMCKPCLDWSERRYHLGGRLGADLLERFVRVGWIERTSAGRTVSLSASGRVGVARWLGIDIGGEPEQSREHGL
jgi:hypothetical protein